MKESIRVIGCQGSIQLITATSVVLNQQVNPGTNFKTYLVVYELFVAPGQDLDFFHFIEKLATSGPLQFQKVIYLNPAALQEIQATFMEGGLSAGQKIFHEVTGLESVDELYLTSNWHTGNKILIHALPSARRICYGDSIGIHIPEGYFDQLTPASRFKRIPVVRNLRYKFEAVKLFLKYPQRKPLLKTLRPLNFERGYYISLDLTHQKPSWPCVFTNKQTLIDTFQQYVKGLSPELIRDPILQQPAFTVLMTSNFSEAGKMTMENEISGYLEYIASYAKQGSVVVVKPHPRDSQVKLKELKKVLSGKYKLKVLDGESDYFIPFELLMIMLDVQDPGRLNRIEYHTFSSACLSIKILFGQNPYVGFGEKLVNEYFEHQHRISRNKHEADLKRLLAHF